MSVGGDVDGGIAKMKEGLELFRKVGAKIPYPYYSSYLADAYIAANRPAEAFVVLNEAHPDDRSGQSPLEMVRANVDCNYEPEVLRLLGEARFALRDLDGAKARLLEAIALARSQGAKLLELRSSTSLARVLRDGGDAAEATKVLKDVRSSFSDGVDFPPLRAADQLLLEL
jgi:tetratricopeptide (TPR) repeat protein